MQRKENSMDFVTIYIIVIDEKKPRLEQKSFETVGKVNVKEIQFARKNVYSRFMYCGQEFNEVELYNPFVYPGPYYITNNQYKEL